MDVQVSENNKVLIMCLCFQKEVKRQIRYNLTTERFLIIELP